jgi:hypothetical protein
VKSLVGAALILLSLGGCAGYHLGPIQPYYLRSVHKLAIPTVENKTLVPRISVLVTDTIIKQFQQDGTYQIVGDDDADATLHCTITHITRAPLRSVIGNVLATLEFNLALRIRYSVTDKSGKTISGPADVYGTTSFFVGPDITSDERQALPLAAEEMAKRLVSQLSEGW